VTLFDDERSVTPRGDGLLDGTGGRLLAASETRIKAGGVESSNVQPIAETTAMIDVLRSYQMSQRMTESLDDLRQRAIDRLGRSGQ
jgi:flagellar basal-body rod protein FlgF